jgi:hypothetical protein
LRFIIQALGILSNVAAPRATLPWPVPAQIAARPSRDAMATEYELERERRIAQNKAKLEVSYIGACQAGRTRQRAGGEVAKQQRAPAPSPAPRRPPNPQELGVNESVEGILATKPAKAKPAKRKAAPAPAEGEAEVRRSQRPRAEVSYVYKEERGEGGGREPVDYTEKIKALQIEAEEAEKLRAELEAKRSTDGDKKARGGAKSRGPKDSGKGVRVQVRRRGGWGRVRRHRCRGSGGAGRQASRGAASAQQRRSHAAPLAGATARQRAVKAPLAHARSQMLNASPLL